MGFIKDIKKDFKEIYTVYVYGPLLDLSPLVALYWERLKASFDNNVKTVSRYPKPLAILFTGIMGLVYGVGVLIVGAVAAVKIILNRVIELFRFSLPNLITKGAVAAFDKTDPLVMPPTDTLGVKEYKEQAKINNQNIFHKLIAPAKGYWFALTDKLPDSKWEQIKSIFYRVLMGLTAVMLLPMFLLGAISQGLKLITHVIIPVSCAVLVLSIVAVIRSPLDLYDHFKGEDDFKPAGRPGAQLLEQVHIDAAAVPSEPPPHHASPLQVLINNPPSRDSVRSSYPSYNDI